MVILIALLGWFGGILINYLSDVLPTRRKLTRPFCLNCDADQPILNNFFWPRRCPNCQHRRHLRSWVVEIVLILLTVWLWENPSNWLPLHLTEALSISGSLRFLLSYLIIIYFSIVLIIDLEHHLILYATSVFGAFLCASVGYLLHGLLNTILGGLCGLGFMLVLYMFGVLFAKYVVRRKESNFNEDALGFGDVILGGVLGLLLGYPGIFAGLILSILIAGFFALVFLVITIFLRRYKLFSFLPYGPFMIISAVLLIFFNQQMIALLSG
jgi:leader peptidase (prepilin peptidase)/N-methyltransferase